MRKIIARLFCYLVFPLAASLITWVGVSTLLGESMTAKGITFITAGVVLGGVDIYSRMRRSSHRWGWLFVTEEFVPTIVHIPLWFVGILICASGISLIVEDQT